MEDKIITRNILEKAAIMARDAIVQEYKLTDKQAEKLNYEPDSTYITYCDACVPGW